MSEKQVSLHDLEGLRVVSIEGGDNGWDDPDIVLEGGVTVTIKHNCCGCCDGGYTIEAVRNE